MLGGMVSARHASHQLGGEWAVNEGPEAEEDRNFPNPVIERFLNSHLSQLAKWQGKRLEKAVICSNEVARKRIGGIWTNEMACHRTVTTEEIATQFRVQSRSPQTQN